MTGVQTCALRSRLEVNVDAQRTGLLHQLDSFVDEAGEMLNPVQKGFNVELNSWSPGLSVALFSPAANLTPKGGSAIHFLGRRSNWRSTLRNVSQGGGGGAGSGAEPQFKHSTASGSPTKNATNPGAAPKITHKFCYGTDFWNKRQFPSFPSS